MVKCRWCKADCASKGLNFEKEDCLGYIPMTNGDRLRNMTDAELSVELTDLVINALHSPGLTHGKMTREQVEQAHFDWLMLTEVFGDEVQKM